MSAIKIDPTDLKLLGALLAVLLAALIVTSSGCATITAALDDWAGYENNNEVAQ